MLVRLENCSLTHNAREDSRTTERVAPNIAVMLIAALRKGGISHVHLLIGPTLGPDLTNMWNYILAQLRQIMNISITLVFRHSEFNGDVPESRHPTTPATSKKFNCDL